MSSANVQADLSCPCLHAVKHIIMGWPGGAKVLGKLPVPGRPTYLDNSRERAYCACSRCGWGCSHLLFLYSFSLSMEDGPIYAEILSQRAIKPKTTNHTLWRKGEKYRSFQRTFSTG